MKKLSQMFLVMMLAAVLLCGCGGSSVPGTVAEVDKSIESTTADVQSDQDDNTAEESADASVEDNETTESADDNEDSDVEIAESEKLETDDASADETEVAALDEEAEENVASDSSEEEVQENKKDKKDKKEKKEKSEAEGTNSDASVTDITEWIGQEFEKIKPELNLSLNPMAALFGISEENATDFNVGDDAGASISYSKDTGLVNHACAYSDSFSAAGAQCGMSVDEVDKIYKDAGFELSGSAYFDGDFDEAKIYSNGKVVIEVGPGDQGVYRLDVYLYDDYDISWLQE